MHRSSLRPDPIAEIFKHHIIDLGSQKISQRQSRFNCYHRYTYIHTFIHITYINIACIGWTVAVAVAVRQELRKRRAATTRSSSRYMHTYRMHTYIISYKTKLNSMYLSGHAGPARCVHHDDGEPVFGTVSLSPTITIVQVWRCDGRRAVRVTLCSSKRWRTPS